MMNMRNLHAHSLDTGARFMVDNDDVDSQKWYRRDFTTYMDELMAEVPGKDNYPGMVLISLYLKNQQRIS